MSRDEQPISAKGKELADAFSHWVNGSTDSNEALAREMLADHNTLVQGKFRFFVVLCREFAKQEWGIDPRNEAAHELAKAVVALEEKLYLPLI